MEYTFHQLEIEATEELEADKIIQVDIDQFLEMLGQIGTEATISYDDARQHIVWSRFPVIPKEIDNG